MRIYQNLAILASVALIAAACQRETPDGPTPGGEEKTVNTQFVLNVATGTTPATKQSAETVQKNNNFRGMQDAVLKVFQTGKAESFAAPVSSDATATKSYDLGNLYASGDVSASDAAATNSHKIIDLSLPLQTDAALFYAKALVDKETSRTGGYLKMAIDDNPANTTMSLGSRLVGEEESKNYTEANTQTLNLVAAVLNDILASEKDGESWATLGKNYVTNTNGDSKDDVEMTPVEEILGELYSRWTTINTEEYRAGSSHSVRGQIAQLDSSVVASSKVSDSNNKATGLATEIKSRIDKYFTVPAAAGDTCKFKSVSTITAALTGVTADKVTDDNLNNYPVCYNLPAGSIKLAFADKKFSFHIPSDVYGASTVAYGNYMFPAELAYFDNSLLRVSNTEYEEKQYPDGVNNWISDDKWTADWTIGKVASTTRSVAVKNNINYGVAMLATTVKYKATTLEDNRAQIVGNNEKDKKITVSDDLFTLNGVLVGGQSNEAGWDFLPKSGAKFDHVVYDDDIVDGKVTSAGTQPTYTLLLDNYDPSTATDGNATAQSTVYVALEFKNNGEDFYGKHNLIRKGDTFYLVGKLILDGKKISAWDSNYPVPPYTADGTSQEVTRIFVQDFLTTANFSIGEKSLQNAVLTVPDLRSSQMTLGLSVDISWQTGLSFDDIEL